MATATLVPQWFLKTQPQEIVTPKFNIFSGILNKSQLSWPTSYQAPKSIQAWLSVKTWPTSFQIPKVIQQSQQVKPTWQVARIWTQTQASWTDFMLDLQTDIKKGMPMSEVSKLYPELWWDETLISQLYTDLKAWMPLSEVPRLYPELWKQEQWFIWWAYEKTKESFVWWIKRIWEAWVWIAEWKYTPMEWAMRWWAWALQTFFSPVSWVLWETLQTWIEQIPEDIRTKIKQEATPTIEWVKDWYNSQPPEQKRRLDNAWVWAEILLNFLWLKWAQKTGQVITKTWKQIWENVWEQVLKQWEKIATKSATIWKTIEEWWEKFRNTIAWLQDNEIQALKNTPTEEFETMLSQAKKAVWDDYAQTPYHEWAKKANESFKILEKNLSDNQVKRIEAIKNSWVSSIDTKSVREQIVKDLENTFNVKWIKVENWKIKYTPTKWRASLLDEANPKDLEAIRLLESVSRSKTPLEMMDTIKKMQNLIYDSSILNRTSKDMYNLVKRSIWKLNQTFKEQVWWDYAKILEEMSWDIKLKYDLDKVFKAWLDEVGNRWELAMKRLAKWTTTSSDVRNLALKIKERTWIDLIKEARLRQLVMDLAWDNRWASLFWVIQSGKRWMIGYWVTKAKEFTPFSKEKTAIARTKKLLPNDKTNANTSNTNNSTFNSTNKKTTWNTTNKAPVVLIRTNNKLLKAPTTPTKAITTKKTPIKPTPTPLLKKKVEVPKVNKINKKGFLELNPKLPTKLKPKSNTFWINLKKAQDYSDLWKSDWNKINVLRKEIEYRKENWFTWWDYKDIVKEYNTLSRYYDKKMENIINAIETWDKNKIILSFDWWTPVIYFELPNGQASFHIPWVIENRKYKEFAEKYWIRFVESKVVNWKLISWDYKWSWKNNTREIIDEYNKTPNPINNKGFINLNPKLPKPLKPKVSDSLIESKVLKPKVNEVKPIINSKQVNISDTKQVDNLYNEYKKTNTSSNWSVIIDSDNIKKMFTDYDSLKPELVHKQSSALSKKFYEKSLKENPNKKVVLLAWWGWSGKSEMLVKSIKQWEPAIVFDWTWKSYDNVVKNYDLAKSYWKTPSVEVLYIDYQIAKRFNLNRERVVPEDILEWTHSWYRKTLDRILTERPDIPVKLRVNSWVKVNWKPVWYTIPSSEMHEFIKLRQDLEIVNKKLQSPLLQKKKSVLNILNK